MSNAVKRSIQITGAGLTLEITKAAVLHLSRPFFHLDELEDGTWRMTYSSALIEGDNKLDFISFDHLNDPSKKSAQPMFMYLKLLDGKNKHLPIRQLRLKKCHGVPREVLPRFIHIDGNVKNEDWKLIYSNNLILDLPSVKGFLMVREDG